MMLPRFALVLLAAVTLAAAGASPGLGGDTVVVAVNTRDGASVFRVLLSIRRVTGDVVDTSNAAVAAASCSSCRTVAVSIQGLLLFDDPSIFTPANLAFAANVECSGCETLAAAYQFAIQTGRPVHLTAEGNRRLAAVRRALQQLRREELSLWDLQARVDLLAGEVLDVLLTEVVAP